MEQLLEKLTEHLNDSRNKLDDVRRETHKVDTYRKELIVASIYNYIKSTDINQCSLAKSGGCDKPSHLRLSKQGMRRDLIIKKDVTKFNGISMPPVYQVAYTNDPEQCGDWSCHIRESDTEAYNILNTVWEIADNKVESTAEQHTMSRTQDEIEDIETDLEQYWNNN